jgi:drug/metabolite transporter (DMT)-like permease
MRLPPSYVAAGPATTAETYAPGNGEFWIFSSRGGYDESWSSLIGIITAIVGNVLISFALNMQRYAHIRLDREWQESERQRKKRSASGTSISRLAEEGSKNDGKRKYHSPRRSEDVNEQTRGSTEASENDPLIPQSPLSSPTRPSLSSKDSDSSSQEATYKQKSYLKSPYWWAGIILMTVGEAGNFLAYGFAPASIVSPLGVVALISNCIIAPFMLKEPFRIRDALGVVIAVGGAVTVVLSANDDNPKLGPGEIWKLISTWEFETYLGITVGVIAILMVASNRYGDKNILIDLGLVGLFGMWNAPELTARLQNLHIRRRLHGSLNQRCCFATFLHSVACHHFPSLLPASSHLGRHCCYADQICQPGTATLRCYAGHSSPIRSLHIVRHPWISGPLP